MEKTHKQLVLELLQTGMTQKELGIKLGRSQGWVGAVLADHYQDIKWREGEALRALHRERCQTVEIINGAAA